MTRPPKQSIPETALVDDRLLHEELVALFGALVMWCRSDALQLIDRLLESEQERNALAMAFRGVYDEAAQKLDSEQKTLVSELNARAISHFGKGIMTLLAGTGMSLPVSSQLVARFRLVVELCDHESGEVVREEVINRGGKKFFADYWNTWINRDRSHKSDSA